MSASSRSLPHRELEAFAARLLNAGGFTEGQARDAARLLVWANLRGAASHGVMRIPRYIEMVQTGLINPGAQMQVSRQKGAVCVLDCGGTPGPTAMLRAADEAMARAKLYGIGWCSARAISHAGAIGYYASRVAEAGMIGIVMCASGPLMSYHGATGAALATNPLAISTPVGPDAQPLLLDMSTSSAAWGKVLAARAAGAAIPLSWGTDADGVPTSDPDKLVALSPMAGAKGSGLALMIEVLTSVLASNAIIAPALTGAKGGRFNGLVLAIEIDALCDPEAFSSELAALTRAIHGLPPAEQDKPVLLPGERGYQTAERLSQTGIQLTPKVLDELVVLAGTFGVPTDRYFGHS